MLMKSYVFSLTLVALVALCSAGVDVRSSDDSPRAPRIRATFARREGGTVRIEMKVDNPAAVPLRTRVPLVCRYSLTRTLATQINEGSEGKASGELSSTLTSVNCGESDGRCRYFQSDVYIVIPPGGTAVWEELIPAAVPPLSSAESARLGLQIARDRFEGGGAGTLSETTRLYVSVPPLE